METIKAKIDDIQKRLRDQKIDGWLFYDFRKSNSLAVEFLELPLHLMLSRRFFYFVPSQGEPVKIVHAIESFSLDHLPGKKITYLSWQSLEDALKEILTKVRVVLMEYSHKNSIPYISKVDGGTLELVKSYGCEVQSSASFLQYYCSVMDEEQKKSHLEAAEFLDGAVSKVWTCIADKLKKSIPITEYDVQQFIMKEFAANGFVSDHPPICCVNAHSANPHYDLTQQNAATIKQGDFILIDLWCKKQTQPRAVFADITRVAIAASKVPEKHYHVFQIVRSAQRAAIEYVISSLEKKKAVKGCDVDMVARKVIKEAGFEDFFVHRTGHNIFIELHGPGANLDSLETLDTRILIPNTCYSVEPGIYLSGEFGIRLECDLLITPQGVQVTGGVQDTLPCLL
jgi:Xaa-Pro aminopeptidase